MARLCLTRLLRGSGADPGPLVLRAAARRGLLCGAARPPGRFQATCRRFLSLSPADHEADRGCDRRRCGVASSRARARARARARRLRGGGGRSARRISGTSRSLLLFLLVFSLLVILRNAFYVLVMRTEERVSISAFVDSEDHKRLVDRARLKDRSVSAELRVAIRGALRKVKPDEPTRATFSKARGIEATCSRIAGW